MSVTDNTLASTADEDLLRRLPTLWQVHIHEEGTIQAAPSCIKAEELASAMRAHLAGMKESRPNEVPKLTIAVELWAGTRGSHADDLKDWPQVATTWGIQP